MNRFLRFFGVTLLGFGILFAAPPASSSPHPADAIARLEADNTLADISLNNATAPSYAHERASARLARATAEEGSRYKTIMGKAAPAARVFLQKAFAAGHSLSAIESFATRIDGKDEAWLRNVLRLTTSTKFYGIKQQWKHSCGPTTVMALLGEIDPLYAYRVRAENPNFYSCDDSNAIRFNPRLAEEQRRMLERRSTNEAPGKAVARGAAGGEGRWILDLLNEHTSRTGLTFTFRPVGPGLSVSQALALIEPALNKRIPIPIVIGSKDNTHCVLITALIRKDGRTSYNMHDPWTGQTVNRTMEQFLNGTLNIASNPRLHSVYVPATSARK